MNKLVTMALMIGFLSGCLVRTGRTNQRNQGSRARCPPSQHWDHGRCVHNGHKKHKDKHDRGRDHR